MKRFRYPLDPVLKQQQWDIDALKTELAVLNQALTAQLGEQRQLEISIHDLERHLQELCRENMVIGLDRKQRVDAYLSYQRSLLLIKQEQVKQAQALTDQVFDQLCRKRQEQRSIENHRARRKKDHHEEGLRLQALEADELWLAKLAANIQA